MDKKMYVMPEIDVVDINVTTSLLAGSNGLDEGGNSGTPDVTDAEEDSEGF